MRKDQSLDKRGSGGRVVGRVRTSHCCRYTLKLYGHICTPCRTVQQREHRRVKMPARSSKAARDYTPKESSTAPSQIRATSQQSRFHLASIEADTTAIDLETVCIATGENEVIVDASLRIKEGVRYGLIGRNGCGKSSEYWYIV